MSVRPKFSKNNIERRMIKTYPSFSTTSTSLFKETNVPSHSFDFLLHMFTSLQNIWSVRTLRKFRTKRECEKDNKPSSKSLSATSLSVEQRWFKARVTMSL